MNETPGATYPPNWVQVARDILNRPIAAKLREALAGAMAGRTEQDLAWALEGTSARHWEILQLRYFHATPLTGQQIGDRLGITARAVNGRRDKAVRRLIRRLNESAAPSDPDSPDSLRSPGNL